MPYLLLFLLFFLGIANASDVGALPDALQRVVDGHQLDKDGIGILVQEIGADAPLLSLNAEKALHPASTIKLLTTFVALDELGPAHSWTTNAKLDGELVDGRLAGNLVLIGGGDPYLITQHYWTLLRRLRANGLQHIGGDLVIDDSYFEPPNENPGRFDGEPFRAYNVLPNALLVNFKSAQFRIRAGNPSVGIATDPEFANLTIRNQVRLINSRCTGFQRGVAFNVKDPVRLDTVIFSGTFPDRCSQYSLYRTVLMPETFAFGVFKPLWEQLGGTIDGGVSTGRADEEAPVFARLRSPSLAEVIRSVNKHSNNVMTRQLLLTLGAERMGVPGTQENGIETVRFWLAENAIAMPSLALINGAGLSRDTRISPNDMASLLLAAWHSPYMPEFIASMPLSGMDGTLRDRLDRAPYAGRMHIKTGRLDHVAAIAGYVQARSDKRYVVVLMINGRDVHRGTGEALQDAVMRWTYDQ